MAAFLKLEAFQRHSEHIQERHSSVADEFKSLVLKQLDSNDHRDILAEDLVTFLYLLDKSDIGNAEKAVKRFDAQKLRDDSAVLTGFTPAKFLIVPIALRKCYLLEEVDTALRIFKLASGTKGMISSTMLTMDMLWRKRRYRECVDIACEIIDRSKDDAIIHGTWFYFMSVVAAFRLESAEGLAKAAKIFDAKKQLKDEHVLTSRRIHKLIAYYCILQNHLNAGLALLDQLDHEDVWTANIRTVAYLTAGKIDKAIRPLKEHIGNSPQLRDAVEAKRAAKVAVKESGQTWSPGSYSRRIGRDQLLFRDVFHMLREAIIKSGTKHHWNFLCFVEANYQELVMNISLKSSQQFRYYSYTKERFTKTKDDPKAVLLQLSNVDRKEDTVDGPLPSARHDLQTDDTRGEKLTVADSTVADSTVADSTVADSTVADSTVADSTDADSTDADSADNVNINKDSAV